MDTAVGWPVPYWDLDAAMAVMLLLTAVDEGVEAWLFGVFHGAEALLRELGVPPGRRLVGAVAIGRRAADDAPTGSARTRRRRPSTRSSTGAAGDWVGRPGAAAVSPHVAEPTLASPPGGPPKTIARGLGRTQWCGAAGSCQSGEVPNPAGVELPLF